MIGQTKLSPVGLNRRSNRKRDFLRLQVKRNDDDLDFIRIGWTVLSGFLELLLEVATPRTIQGRPVLVLTKCIGDEVFLERVFHQRQGGPQGQHYIGEDQYGARERLHNVSLHILKESSPPLR